MGSIDNSDECNRVRLEPRSIAGASRSSAAATELKCHEAGRMFPDPCRRPPCLASDAAEIVYIQHRSLSRRRSKSILAEARIAGAFTGLP
jgi:hypothetical protein